MSEHLSLTSKRFIPLCEPFIGGNEERYLRECLETNFVSSVGPFVERFEREFAPFVGAKYAVATCNGTAAIHVALRLVGVGVGDEVLVSTFTFIGSVNPIHYLGGTPVFIDADERTWNLDPHLVVDEVRRRARIGKLPKAVIIVHILGQPADLAPLLEIAAEYQIPVIEDAAESLGAQYKGRYVGTFGQIGCFSFNGNKVMTTGGGGMIVTNDVNLAQRAKHLTTQARLPGLEYQHDEVGYNYRLTNLQAAFGVAQLEQLPHFLDSKRRTAVWYDKAFHTMEGLVRPEVVPGGSSSHWMYSVLVDPVKVGCDRHEMAQLLQERGVHARPLWTPIHALQLYQECPRVGGAVAERLFAQGLSLPCSVGLNEADQQWVIESVVDCYGGKKNRGL